MNLLESLKSCIRGSVPVMILRPPGMGAAQQVRDAAAGVEREVIQINSAMNDTLSLTDAWFSEPIRQALAATAPTVLFIDGIDQMPPTVQHTCVRLLMHRCVIDTPLPAHVTMVVTATKGSSAKVLIWIDPYVFRLTI